MSDINRNEGFSESMYAPHDASVQIYYTWPGADKLAVPYEYTGWMDETLSWKKSCYIHTFLSDCCEAVHVKGPDAEALMSYMCVNNFSLKSFPVGKAKHCIACTPDGNVSVHGMALRVAEDEFVTYYLSPNVEMHMYSGKFDVEPFESDFSRDFIFQLAGPKSLEIVEHAVKQDIHDLKFMAFMDAEILGYPVRILRMGMGGSLSYEVHGLTDHVFEIYNEIMRVGEPYGLRKLGVKAYMCNHTENGFPQSYEHFLGDFETDPDLVAFLSGSYSNEDADAYDDFAESPLLGSLAEYGKNAYYCNPIECGWERSIYWGHEFVGKDALRRIADDPNHRTVVTLEWEPEDILKICATWFDGEEGTCLPMSIPQDLLRGNTGCLADKVVDSAGNCIGKSAGRIYTLYYKKMISMGFVDPTFAKEGTEVTVVYGDSGSRQVPVRAKVARYPYLDLTPNREYDMESIPRYQG